MDWRSCKIKNTWLLVSSMGDIIDVSTNRPIALIDINGYLGFKIHGAGSLFVHRMVAEVFIPKQPGKDVVNHINHVKRDNRLDNLEWVDGVGNLMAYIEFKKNNPLMAELIADEDLRRANVARLKSIVRKLMDKRITGYDFTYDDIASINVEKF